MIIYQKNVYDDGHSVSTPSYKSSDDIEEEIELADTMALLGKSK